MTPDIDEDKRAEVEQAIEQLATDLGVDKVNADVSDFLLKNGNKLVDVMIVDYNPLEISVGFFNEDTGERTDYFVGDGSRFGEDIESLKNLLQNEGRQFLETPRDDWF